MDIASLFQNQFGRVPEGTHFSPGRVNLIGEHTDYNGGAVLPAVLGLGLHIAISRRVDDRLRIVSDGFGVAVTRTLDEAAHSHWTDYALGALVAAKAKGWIDGGADVAIHSNLPVGSGLSSSSALIVGLLKMLRNLCGANVSDAEIAQLARSVEADFIGVPCGIMDQMVIATAPQGNALFLDTHTMERTLLVLPKDPVFVVLHSGVRRKLSDGHYKIRKEECDRAKHELGRGDLCRASLSDLSHLTDTVARRRANHCVSEHVRTKAASKALGLGDYQQFGALMMDSHASMRDDFEITTPEIDALVDDAVQQGALGARMTGGGFGGCVVALVPEDRLSDWRETVLARHPKARWVCTVNEHENCVAFPEHKAL